MTNEAVADLGDSIRTTEGVVSRLHESQLGLGTPCVGWSVAELRAHLIGMLVMYGNAFGSAQPEPAHGDTGGDVTDTAELYAAASSRLLEAVKVAGPDRMVTVPFGTVPSGVATRLATVETLVHGWDLAKATGQPYECNPAVAERALGFSQSALERIPAGRSPFASPVTVQNDAAAIDRLVGLLGRHP